ncbi:MAG: hypothetical protein IJS50_05805 [Desulfovibrio sp.]|nr:hypothetical protein [Desulfovibrio sp.]
MFQGRRLYERLALDLPMPLSMWYCSLLYERHPKMSPALYTIYKLRALEIFLEENKITELTLVGGTQTLVDCLNDLCGKMGLAFKKQKGAEEETSKQTSWLKRLYLKLPAILRASLRFLHFLGLCLTHFPRARLAHSTNKTATIVTYFPNVDQEAASEGRFRSRYFENLHHLLNHRASELGGPFVRWLFIRFPSPQLSLKECCKLKNLFQHSQRDGLSFNYLEEFLSFKDYLKALKNYFKLWLESLRLEASVLEHFHFADSHLSFSSYLASDYVESFRGWRALERCLSAQAFLNYFQEAGPQRFTLFPLENCPWERMVTAIVHGLKLGMVLGAQHSSIRPTDFRYFDDPRVFSSTLVPSPDLILGNGTSAILQWQKAGVPIDQLFMVEALRYLYLASATPSDEDQRKTSDELKEPKPKTLLVLTSFFRDETEAHLLLFKKAWQKGLLQGLNCIIKPHPYLAVEPWLGPEILAKVTIGQKPLPSYFKPGVIVWASNSTTAALEALLRGLQVAVMRPCRDFDLCPIQDVPYLLRTSTLFDVKIMLEQKTSCPVPKDYLCLDPNLSAWKKVLAAFDN